MLICCNGNYQRVRKVGVMFNFLKNIMVFTLLWPYLKHFVFFVAYEPAIDIEGAKINCLSLFMCLLLAQLKIGFFSSFSDAAVYSTNDASKAGLKQSIIFRCLWNRHKKLECLFHRKSQKCQ